MQIKFRPFRLSYWIGFSLAIFAGTLYAGQSQGSSRVINATSDLAQATDPAPQEDNPFAPAIQVVPQKPASENMEPPVTVEPDEAASESEDTGNESEPTANDKPQREWSLASNASLSSDTSFNDPTSSLGLSYSRPWQSYNVSASLSLLKKYYIYPSEDELVLNDPSISLSREVFTIGDLFPFRASLSMTLPLSEFSRDNNIYSRLSAGLSTSEQLLAERLSISYRMKATLHTSEYQSTQGGDGVGGSALPMWSYLLGQSGSYKILETWSLSYSLGYSEITYYDLDPNKVEAATVVDLPDQSYSLSASISWQAFPSLGFEFGFNQGSQILYPGLVDVVIYDEEFSQWFISLQHVY